MKNQKILVNALFGLVCAALTSPLWVFKDFLFPYVTSKAFVLRIAVELALPVYMFLLYKNRAMRPKLKNPLNLFFLAFTLINWASALFGVNPGRSLWGNFERMGGAFYVSHLVALYFYILALAQYSGKYLKYILNFFIAIASIIALNGVSGWLGGPTLTPDPSLPGRASSTLGNPIYLGAFAILPVFICVFFIQQAEKLYAKAIYGFLGLMFFLAMVQSGTRGAMVGFLVGAALSLIAFIALQKSRRIRLVGGIVFILFAVAGFFLFYNPNILPKGTAIRRTFQLKDGNTYARLIQWKSALKGVREYPILGVGPENYYIISNQFYDAAMYQYDRSWFDKPHNYLLEILSTTGILGFLAYLGILTFACIFVFRAFKNRYLSSMEAAALLGGLVAYQVQNLFVFDTVPTSVAFFVFLGLLGFLGTEDKSAKIASGKRNNWDQAFLSGAIVAAPLAVVMVVYGNVLVALASKNVNYGYAYTSVDSVKAAGFFKQAIDYNYDFLLPEISGRYADYISGIIGGFGQAEPEQKQFIKEQIGKALDANKEASEKVPNDPVILFKLANLYMYQAGAEGKAAPFEAIEAIQKAIDLAPKRIEARTALANIRLSQGYVQEAVKIMEEVAALDDKSPLVKWQLAQVYKASGDAQKALSTGEAALALGYKCNSLNECRWLMDLYLNQKDYSKPVSMIEDLRQRKVEMSGDDYVYIVSVYARAGDTAKARMVADNILKIDPSKKEILDKILPAP